MALLNVNQLNAYYGKSHILQGVNMSIDEGEIVSLLGRNGVGRSTTCKSIMGEVPPKGSITFRGKEIAGLAPHQIAQSGIGYVPENRDVFPGLTVKQNLNLGVKPGQGASRWSEEDFYELFPNLRERQDVDAAALSGGEQQMLTMARTLMGDPDVVMIDEPTEGLSPQMCQRVADLLEEIARRKIAILLVEQKLTIALKISKRVYVMGHGQIVYEGTPEELMNNDDIRQEWLEV
ncbi:ABC transporter ATP-binding protein [bacterium]|nr:ABC transporter ATP-binding protein [bacterium]